MYGTARGLQQHQPVSHHDIYSSHYGQLMKHRAQVSTALTEIHGQYPVPIDGIRESLFRKRTPEQENYAGHLVLVPQSMEVVRPFRPPPDSEDTEIRQVSQMGLACNYSALKATAAIKQT